MCQETVIKLSKFLILIKFNSHPKLGGSIKLFNLIKKRKIINYVKMPPSY